MAGPFAELHCHSNFSFLDGASTADDLVERAVELGLSALALTDHQGLYGAVRSPPPPTRRACTPSSAWRSSCSTRSRRTRRAIVVARRRSAQAALEGSASTGGSSDALAARLGSPTRRRGRSRHVPSGQRLPGHREPRREDLRGVRARELGPHLVLLAARRDAAIAACAGWPAPRTWRGPRARRASPMSCWPSTRRGSIALIGLPPRGDRAAAAGGVTGTGRERSPRCRRLARRSSAPQLFVELQHHLLPDDDWLVAETGAPGRRARAADSS